MNNPMIMPFKIVVSESKSILDGKIPPRFYTKSGEAVYSMEERASRKKSGKSSVVEFTEAMYIDLISISSPADVREFTEKYPNVRFAFHNVNSSKTSLQLDEYETFDRYCEMVSVSVNRYNDLRNALTLFLKNKKNPAPETRSEMMAIYRKRFPLLNKGASSWTTLDEMEEYYFNTYKHGNEEIEEMLFDARRLDPTVSFDDVYEEFYCEKEELRRQNEERIWRTVDSVVENKLYEEVSDCFASICQEAETVYNVQGEILQAVCPDLLTAMYLMTFVVIHNEHEYKLCKKKGCHQYFLVDKWHPQTLCPTHMAPRQRKRQNARYYEKHGF